MGKQILVPVESADDADIAVRGLIQTYEPQDEIVIVVVAEEPEQEFVGTEPGPPVEQGMLGHGGGVMPGSYRDVPVFVPREEMLEIKHREIYEALNYTIAPLREHGFEVRVDAIFSNEPSEALASYARDIEPSEVAVTHRSGQTFLKETGGKMPTRVLPD